MATPHNSDLPVFGTLDKNFSGDLILAVHGMGDQVRNDFVQSVAHLVGHHFATEKKLVFQATLLPLGAWDSGRETHVDDEAVYFCDESDPTKPLGDCAFAEVYWADVARTLETEGYRIEEVKHWARSVVERLGQRYGGRGGLAPRSLHLAAFVIEEIAEILAVIGTVLSFKKIAGFSKRSFDLSVIRALGDVQQVGDYVRQRQKIRLRFLNRLSWICNEYRNARIHIIAHSEGSPVALFSLLSALNQDYQDLIVSFQEEWRKAKVEERKERNWFDNFCKANGALENPTRGKPEPENYTPIYPQYDWLLERWKTLCQPNGSDKFLKFDWVHRLESFTTLGSPIDKHLLLWPEMWKEFSGGIPWVELLEKKPSPKRIRWRNHFDYADPVGYTLDTARAKLAPVDEQNPANWGCSLFEFEEKHDHGFRRSAISGQAHLDYFRDHKLFSYIVEDSIKGGTPDTEPGSNVWGYFGRIFPFLIVCLVCLVAVFCFHRGLLPDTGSTADSAAKPEYAEEIFGTTAEHAMTTKEYTWGVLGCTALLIGTIVLARIYRLSTNVWMRLFALLIYAGGAALYWRFPGYNSLEATYGLTKRFVLNRWLVTSEIPMKDLCRGVFIGLNLLIPLTSWIADALAIRKRLRPIWGLRLSIGIGAILLFVALVYPRLALGIGISATSLIGGWIAFVLAWWISTLLFDLAFCWQRYINVERSWLSVVRDAAQEANISESQAQSVRGSRPEAIVAE